MKRNSGKGLEDIDRNSTQTGGLREQAFRELKPYSSPKLLDYGSIGKLTQTGEGPGTDSGTQAGMMMQCL